MARDLGGSVTLTTWRCYSLSVALLPFVLAGCGEGGIGNGNGVAGKVVKADDADRPVAAATSEVGDPKPANVEVPAWARDDLGCEVQGALPFGTADQVAGIGVGMPVAQIRKHLQCYKISVVYKNGMYYSPNDDGKTVQFDAWILDAKRSYGNSLDSIEVLLAGPKESLQAIEISQTIRSGRTHEDMPQRNFVVDALKTQYRLTDKGGAILTSIQSPNGDPLTFNSPKAITCNSPTATSCGQRIFVGLMVTPIGTLFQHKVTISNGAKAKPILDASHRTVQ